MKEKDVEKEVVAMGKLKKEKVEVSINPKKYLLDYAKSELKNLEGTSIEGFSDEDIKLYDLAKQNLKSNIKEYEVAKLEGFIVPLKYGDLQTIKNGVLEALKTAKEFNWDDDIRVRGMIREEHTLTVYLMLRKKEDITKRYYDSLEEIAKETESTIDELYTMYLENFVLTDEERKNL